MTIERHDAHTKPLFTRLNIMTLHENVFYSNIKLTYDILKLNAPIELQNILKLNYYDYSINTRGNSRRLLRRPEIMTTKYGLYSIRYRLVLNWNALQTFISKELTTLSSLKVRSLATEFLSQQL